MHSPLKIKPDLLLIDDDEDVLDACRQLFSLSGYMVRATSSPQKALEILSREWDGVVISDIYMPAMNGLTLLEEVHKVDPQIPVIMITGHGDIPLAVKAVKMGAFDFIEKPLDPPTFLALVKKASTVRHQWIARRETIRDSLADELLGSSAQINELREQLGQLALTSQDLMLEGPRGVGRTTLASLLHRLGPSSGGALEQLDCALIEESASLKAAMERARGGTLILRGLEQLSHECQHWLASFLLEAERRQTKDVRTIAILETQAETLVENQQLTPECFYYFSQVRIKLPPLCERTADIEPLFMTFLKESCRRLSRKLPVVEARYLDNLRQHHWPGNIRELRNVAELYAVGIVKLANVQRIAASPSLKGPLDELVEDYEKRLIEDALFLFCGRVTEAADHLNVPRKKLYLRMKKYGLDKECFKPSKPGRS
ncbi:sigma-54 dependent transcriptional regulator [Shewanella sp. JM162201]|uniref:Sigma-54 dependent transcriptional regulator n=1 Tax=Shewanella jiangmenensis TaxID=2837387 RepID=A0ABS5V7Y5_9GAMM|nr:sigma-54 dependent transcriptional regulator [Shewanella jiangmenensis]MBT1446559.1 sigma-54 dependent transcriptional regulator [Shewanella jiangmenensis]